MGENSAISWTDHTFNPWWGCTKVGLGCDHCYAEAFDKRVGGSHWGAGASRRLIKDWSAPRKWQKTAERHQATARSLGLPEPKGPWVFCASMADVFDNEVAPEWRGRLWDLVRETPALRWIFVTKRIGNAAKMLPDDWTSGAFSHCGLVSTIVNQAEADRDIPKLLATPAAWRGLSMEPLLGSVDLTWALGNPLDIAAEFLRRGQFAPGLETLRRLDWIIVGGESGPGARPMHPDWARAIRDQCAAAGVPFHFKQHGEWIGVPDLRRLEGGAGPGFGRFDHCQHDMAAEAVRVGKARAGRLLDGVEHNGMPQLVEPRHD